ncbi:MAG: asparagine synthase-related protein [Limisphaerales bacterium]
MSVIAGILNLSAEPAEPALVAALLNGVGEIAQGSMRTLADGPVTLGQASVKHFPRPAQLAVRPHGAEARIAVTLHGRLHYRDELGDELGLSPGERSIPDAELILRAYEKWGEDCVAHLCGDFAFALWDGHARKLLLARAPQGIDALYYCQTPQRFAFGSSVKALLALPGFPVRPNLLRVAQILTLWGTDVAQCGYEGILRLPPAHTLTVTAEGQPRLRRYWFPEEAGPLLLKSDEEYVEAFLERYSRAVRERLTGRVAATLSGGLDSGSVCALAARELRAQGKSLPAYTSVPKHKIEFEIKNVPFDESPGAGATRAFLGNVTVEHVRAEGVSPLAGISRMLAALDEPGHAAGNAFWLVDLMDRAKQAGATTLLTGQMGNGTVSWFGWPESLWPDVLRGRWRRVASAVPQMQATWPLVMRRHLVRPIVGPLQQIWNSRKWRPDVMWLNSVLRREFGDALELPQRMRATGQDPYACKFDSPATRLGILKIGCSSLGHRWDHPSVAFGVEVADPTMDARLTEFCLRVPNDQYYRRGEYRHLLRRAMKGLLPEEVRLSSRRGRQGMDFGYRVLETKGEFETMLTRLEASPLASEVLDLSQMRTMLSSLDWGINLKNTEACMGPFARGIQAGMFLLRFD